MNLSLPPPPPVTSSPSLFRVQWARRVHSLGYFAVRQAVLRRGGTMQDVAWILVTTLLIQGV